MNFLGVLEWHCAIQADSEIQLFYLFNNNRARVFKDKYSTIIYHLRQFVKMFFVLFKIFLKSANLSASARPLPSKDSFKKKPPCLHKRKAPSPTTPLPTSATDKISKKPFRIFWFFFALFALKRKS